MKNYLIIYDVRGIQKYIFKTNRIKEISGASIIVKNLLIDELNSCLKKFNWKTISNWEEQENFTCFTDKDVKVEYIYNGGGNLLIAFKGDDNELKELNKALQIAILKKSYSLSLAYASIELEENEDYKHARDRVKEKLNVVKTRMPEVVMQKALPLVESDPITGFPKSDVITYLKENNIPFNNYYTFDIQTIESAIKEISSTKVKANNTFLDAMVDNKKKHKEISTDKNMIAVVHIDGNDMGAMISKYNEMIEDNNKSLSYQEKFALDVKNSRYISKKINEVFNTAINEIFQKEKYKPYTRMIINSGDDITFICTAGIAIELSKEIMTTIESHYLAPENNSEKYRDNKFSSCAGICFIHSHFPFYRAYEIAEEVCSIAKTKAKQNKVMTSLPTKNDEPYYRPSSYLDFYICDASIIKSISEIREENKNLYLRPYLVNTNLEDKQRADHIDNLLFLISSFRKKKNNKYVIARSTLKEIRNTYEKPTIYTKMLFKRLESRSAFKAIDGLDYNPYLNNVARYYDATTLLDLIDGINEEEGDNDELHIEN